MMKTLNSTKLDKVTPINKKLKILNISNTQIASIDIDGLIALTELNASKTKLTDLNISSNEALTKLDISNTKITSLDASNNTNLQNLDCSNTNMAWLNIGDNPKLTTLKKGNSTINLGQIGDTFKIQEKFPGIDPKKVTIQSGAKIDTETGEVSGYLNGTPIVYEYHCGRKGKSVETLNEAGMEEVSIQVTLNFKKI